MPLRSVGMHCMTDDDFGRLARAVLKDLELNTTDEGRFLTLVRALWHIEDVTRREALEGVTPSSHKLVHAPGWAECVALAKGQALAPGEDPGPDVSDVVPTPDELGQIREMADRDIAHLLATAPGPLTTCFRRLAAVTASAHLACQWGCIAAAVPMMRWCAGAMSMLHDRCAPPPKVPPPEVQTMVVLALVASVATERRFATLATTLTRRLTADLGALARAAARLEGAAECDPHFDGDENVIDSVRGLKPAAAEAAARSLGRALDLLPAGLG